MTKMTSNLRSETRHMKATDPKAIEVLKEIKADLLAKTDNNLIVAAVATQIIEEFKYRTTKQ